ncbi:hypothetical protein [Brevibacillus sp. IT-7CA2]|uniref:hypothetical protein n=1 Tax=Brevibacillus sp. IT-7CA2 TaxID=3026436 RepID=UPI0039E161CC
MISIIGIVIATASLITEAPILRILTMFVLAIVMTSLGTFELKKNRKMAFIMFGVAAFQVFVLADMIYVTATK